MPGQNYHGLNGFDINYNHLSNYTDYSLPNDLVIGPAAWGHVPYPVELQLANKVLSAWLCIRPDALFSGVKQTPDGTWGYSDEPLPMPAVWPMADIPPGGYSQADVSDAEASQQMVDKVLS